jgi:hypothetical protein
MQRWADHPNFFGFVFELYQLFKGHGWLFCKNKQMALEA